MLGQTTPGVMRLRESLVRAGHEPVIFHANGVGGPAMEHLCEEGALQGVVDYTLSELANSLMDGIHATGPERLTVAGRCGLPQVVVPGCVDFFNQGPRDTLPEQYRSRKSYFHNPVATLVRLERDEEVAARRARRRAAERRGRPGARRRAAARVLAGRRRGRRPLGPGRRRRVPGLAVVEPALRHPVRGRRRARRRPRLRRRRRRPLPRAGAGSMSERPVSELPARPGAAGHRVVPGALGHRAGPDRLVRAARRAPAARHGHDHGAGGVPPRGGQGRRALHGAAVDRLLAAAHARDVVGRGDDHACARRR